MPRCKNGAQRPPVYKHGINEIGTCSWLFQNWMLKITKTQTNQDDARPGKKGPGSSQTRKSPLVLKTTVIGLLPMKRPCMIWAWPVVLNAQMQEWCTEAPPVVKHGINEIRTWIINHSQYWPIPNHNWHLLCSHQSCMLVVYFVVTFYWLYSPSFTTMAQHIW